MKGEVLLTSPLPEASSNKDWEFLISQFQARENEGIAYPISQS